MRQNRRSTYLADAFEGPSGPAHRLPAVFAQRALVLASKPVAELCGSGTTELDEALLRARPAATETFGWF
jgi:hypothetical protein